MIKVYESEFETIIYECIYNKIYVKWTMNYVTNDVLISRTFLKQWIFLS